jgi:RNA polymerase sigma-70 factor (ECF subfamily)
MHPFEQHSPPPDNETAAERDDRLVAGMCAGDESAFAMLYLTYHLPLWKFAYGYVRSREIAEELVQDVFLTLWRRRSDIGVRESIRAWLYAAVRNQAFKHQRHTGVVDRAGRDARFQDHVGDQGTNPPGMGEPPIGAEDALHARELEAAIAHAVEALPERRRLAVTLRWKHGLSIQEIAGVLGSTPESVRVLLMRARKDLAALLGAGWMSR